jgi:1-aminocyclopropane-1-carboxylate deaminase/D-cysteine desulfhydrase-like pyridoxal-dependent ACC family enzyme
MAAAGAQVLAEEIMSFWSEQGSGRPLSVCVPGGTCTTAALLHLEIKRLQKDLVKSMDIQVVVIPCVGGDAYARRQMMSLSLQVGGRADDSPIPTVLAPAPDDYYMSAGQEGEKLGYFTFGEPEKSILENFQLMRDEHGLTLDLIYGAPSFVLLLRHWQAQRSADVNFDPNNPIAGREIMYVHSGGVEGISSQLLRYKYKGLIAIEDIQLPGRDRR